MDNRLNLIIGQEYLVTKPFVDYDGITHGVGETWTYQGTNFHPYEDGLTLYVLIDNKAVVYRFQWRKDAQAEIIENFKDYVEPY
jgi:Domain of unknown function (DUF3601)